MGSGKIRRPRYRVIDGKHTVELKLRTPHQLFDERDPSPFRERDLDDDAARYILGSYSDVKEQEQAKLSLYFETLGEFKDRPGVIAEAIHAFYRYETESKHRELRRIFRQGFMSLVIGLTFLFVCTWASHILETSDKWGFAKIYGEGLHILGWVAMWRPISIFLYEWWPINDERLTFSGLSQIEIDVRLRDEVTLTRPAPDFDRPAGKDRSAAGRPLIVS